MFLVNKYSVLLYLSKIFSEIKLILIISNYTRSNTWPRKELNLPDINSRRQQDLRTGKKTESDFVLIMATWEIVRRIIRNDACRFLAYSKVRRGTENFSIK